jgi:hypothetical protein
MFKFLTEVVFDKKAKSKARPGKGDPSAIDWEAVQKLAVGEIKMQTSIGHGAEAKVAVSTAYKRPEVRSKLNQLAAQGYDEGRLGRALAKMALQA